MPYEKSNRKEQRRNVQRTWVIRSSHHQGTDDAMPYLQAVDIMAANMATMRQRAFTEGVSSGR